jgi:hypothetical protein
MHGEAALALFFCAFHFTIKINTMADYNNREKDNNGHAKNSGDSIGNQQNTAQTGAQNAGGENIDAEEDQYTDDLRNSGDRNSSNRREGDNG